MDSQLKKNMWCMNGVYLKSILKVELILIGLGFVITLCDMIMGFRSQYIINFLLALMIIVLPVIFIILVIRNYIKAKQGIDLYLYHKDKVSYIKQKRTETQEELERKEVNSVFGEMPLNIDNSELQSENYEMKKKIIELSKENAQLEKDAQKYKKEMESAKRELSYTKIKHHAEKYRR